MLTPDTVLQNRWLTAQLDSQTGNLLRLLDPHRPADPVVAGCWCSFKRHQEPVHENPAVPAGRFTVESVRHITDGIESVITTADVRILRRFTLPADAPLLQIHYEIRALHPGVELTHPIALPEIVFGPGFNNQYEDPRDLYFDGAELGAGRELPPWRVFFRAGHDTGLIAATRSKRAMSHFQILDRSFAIKPHIMTAYSTDYTMAYSPLQLVVAGEQAPPPPDQSSWTDMEESCRQLYLGPRASHAASFAIGPWRQADHAQILSAARLHEPVQHPHEPLRGAPPQDLQGVVLRVADCVDASATSEEYAPDRWFLAPMPHCTGGRALISGTAAKPPPLTLHPRLQGVYRVYVGAGNGDGIVAKFSGDPMPMYRIQHGGAEAMNPFVLRLAGAKKSREIFLKTVRMDGQSLQLRRMPSTYAATVLDYVRFEPLTDAQIVAWERTQRAEPAVELSGFNDIPDIAKFDDMLNPDPLTYEANLWEHAQCKIRKVYWRIDGQCSDFPSKHNTMRYVSAKVHGLFTPQSKAYGRALLKTDLLKLAVNAAKKYGLKLYGWQRFNNYSGNVASDFFKQHPQFHEADSTGKPRPKLCLAHPEVRRHKIDILCEAAAYGLAGLSLGFLRHPPVLLYAPILVEGYRREFTLTPPPEPAKELLDQVQTHPEQFPDYLNWYKYRARFLTQFGRELRAALQNAHLPHVKISIWVRPERCLHDGIDIDAWLDEKLCDEVVASSLIHCVTHPLDEAWCRKVQSRVPLITGISGFDITDARLSAPRAIRAGANGICTYESDYAVTDDQFIDLYHTLRTPD